MSSQDSQTRKLKNNIVRELAYQPITEQQLQLQKTNGTKQIPLSKLRALYPLLPEKRKVNDEKFQIERVNEYQKQLLYFIQWVKEKQGGIATDKQVSYFMRILEDICPIAAEMSEEPSTFDYMEKLFDVWGGVVPFKKEILKTQIVSERVNTGYSFVDEEVVGEPLKRKRKPEVIQKRPKQMPFSSLFRRG